MEGSALRILDVVASIWLPTLLGSGLACVGVVLGWVSAGNRSLPPVRLVRSWVRCVAVPVLRSRWWTLRTAAIFANNACALAALLAAGRWHLLGLLAVAALGVGLGMGMRLLSGESEVCVGASSKLSPNARRAVRAGVALNLLEPPAIILTIGLSLGRSATPLWPEQAWTIFALWVIPTILLAAGGEALWIGVISRNGVGSLI